MKRPNSASHGLSSVKNPQKSKAQKIFFARIDNELSHCSMHPSLAARPCEGGENAGLRGAFLHFSPFFPMMGIPAFLLKSHCLFKKALAFQGKNPENSCFPFQRRSRECSSHPAVSHISARPGVLPPTALPGLYPSSAQFLQVLLQILHFVLVFIRFMADILHFGLTKVINDYNI